MSKIGDSSTFQDLIDIIKENTAPISHDHTVSDISDFPQSMPASDVYSWAKAETKPTYTANEVGAIASSEKGANNGVASLGNDGKILDSQLPEITNDDTLLPGFIDKVFGNSQVFYGQNVWTDGTDIYMSNGSYQWVLDRANSTWENKTWTGLTNFLGYNVWTDGEHIYYSNQTYQYELNKQTSEWTPKSWNGLTSFPGQHIWKDGEHIYLSNGGANYELNKETSTWSAKTWTGLTAFYGQHIWKDGEHTYYSYNGANYELNKETSTWSAKTWTGISGAYLTGDLIWDDGKNIYFSYGESGDGKQQYMLDSENNTWMPVHWKGVTVTIYGQHIWKDGEHIYCSPTYSYEFVKLPIKALIGVANGIAELDSNGRIPIEQTNYVTAGAYYASSIGTRSTCEGYGTAATGTQAHAEGASTNATGSYSHAEGQTTTASNSASHAEGYQTQASGNVSHAEGYQTKAKHQASHSSGYGTETGRDNQFVTGSFNKGLANTLLEVGDGNRSDCKHNAFEVISSTEVGIKVGDTKINAIPSPTTRGSVYYWRYVYPVHMSAGTWDHEDWTNKWVKFIVGGDVKKEGFIPQTYNGIEINTTTYTYDGTNDEQIEVQVWNVEFAEGIIVDGDIFADNLGTAASRNVPASGDAAIGEVVIGSDSRLADARTPLAHTHTASDITDLPQSMAELGQDGRLIPAQTNYVSAGRKANTTVGDKSTAEGNNTTASGAYSHAEGTAKATAYASHAEGDATTASGFASHAEGIQTTASGDYSHAEGNYTTAGGYGHAEGERTTASGKWGHAQGYYCTASGLAAHAEGAYCVASNDYSHVEGYYTKTGASYQHAQGKYNVGKATTLFEIGNGTGTSARSNAFEVSSTGDVVAAGSITDGSGNTLSDMVNKSQIGAASGVASLDSSGKVPSSQLPSASLPSWTYVGVLTNADTSASLTIPNDTKEIYLRILVGDSINGYVFVQIIPVEGLMSTFKYTLIGTSDTNMSANISGSSVSIRGFNSSLSSDYSVTMYYR